MSAVSLAEVWHEGELSYTTFFARFTRRKSRSSPMHDYAILLGVSSDGCQTERDVENRAAMLKSVAIAYDEQRLKPIKGWVG